MRAEDRNGDMQTWTVGTEVNGKFDMEFTATVKATRLGSMQWGKPGPAVKIDIPQGSGCYIEGNDIWVECADLWVD